MDIEEYDVEKVEGKEIRYKKMRKEIGGNNYTCVLTFSPKLQEGEIRELEKNILKTAALFEETNEKLKNRRSKIEKTKTNIENRIQGILSKKHMDEIFKIEMEGVRKIKGISYKIDETRKEYIINKYFGKKLIITNRDDWSAEEIIKTYHEQDFIERVFRDSKNSEHFSIRPQYQYTDQKIQEI